VGSRYVRRSVRANLVELGEMIEPLFEHWNE
jgi:hypothetical protein